MLKSLFLMAIGLACDFLLLLAEGFILKVIWNWFIPEYFNAPHLTVKVACGVAIVVSILTSHRNKDNEPKSDSIRDTFSFIYDTIVYRLIALTSSIALAAIVHHFI